MAPSLVSTKANGKILDKVSIATVLAILLQDIDYLADYCFFDFYLYCLRRAEIISK